MMVGFNLVIHTLHTIIIYYNCYVEFLIYCLINIDNALNYLIVYDICEFFFFVGGQCIIYNIDFNRKKTRIGVKSLILTITTI